MSSTNGISAVSSSCDSMKSHKQPVHLTIDNYPITKFHIKKLEEISPTHLKITNSYFTAKLLEALSMSKADTLVLENCTIRNEHGDLLTSSFKHILSIKKCFIIYLVGRKEYEIEEIDDVGIWKEDEDVTFFQPSLKEFSDKAIPVSQDLLAIIDAEKYTLPQVEWDGEKIKKLQLVQQFKEIRNKSMKLVQKAQKILHTERDYPLPVLNDMRYVTYRQKIYQLHLDAKSLSEIYNKINKSENHLDNALIESIANLNKTIESQIHICKCLRRTLVYEIHMIVNRIIHLDV
jgi:hypothetical protein